MDLKDSLFLSIIIPTYNERANLPVLVEKIFSALKGIPSEVVVVDDHSPDGTGEIAENMRTNFPLQVVHRTEKTGLASAVLAGFQKAAGENLCVMDADLSHDPAILPEMAKRLSEGVELVVGSRHVPGGGTKGWPVFRRFGSQAAIALARPVTRIRDATTGFFCFHRSILDGVQLDPLGFKIGLEIFVKGNYRNFAEIPYIFQERLSGKSKLNGKEVWNYLRHLARLYWWKVTG